MSDIGVALFPDILSTRLQNQIRFNTNIPNWDDRKIKK